MRNFVAMIEKQHDAKVKIIITDNGLEFLMPQFYASNGIIHQMSCVENPQDNGRVERKHQHVLNVGRALLFQSKLPKQYWSYAIMHAAYIINRVPSPLLENKCPYTSLHGDLPYLHSLKVFGSLCYASTLHAHRSKLEPRARKNIFLGYKVGVKGYVLLDLNNKELFLSRDVTFHENILPYKPTKQISRWHYHSQDSFDSSNLSNTPEILQISEPETNDSC